MHEISEIVTFDGERVEGDEEIIASFAQLQHGDGRWTPDHAGLIELQDGLKNVRKRRR